MSLPPSLRSLRRPLDRLPTDVSQLLTPARAIAFWTAIALPFGYLPLFALEMIELSPVTFFGLLGLNMIALIVGHPHRR